jgi:raffinose/stachyose/melibiose transport system substrate-binding protein/xylobiose transport system substrate-binding protein
VNTSTTSKLTRLVAVVAVSAIGMTAGCGGNSQPENPTAGSITIWALQDGQNEPIVRDGIESFNSGSSVEATLVTYVNDTYKRKLKESVGTDKGPDVFFNWGGGNLTQYVQKGQVAELTEPLRRNVTASSAFLPSVLDVGKVDGRQYGLPMNGMQPIVLFYNKRIFAEAGQQPPKTFADLLTLVDVFKARKVTPIGLSGQQGWTELMYAEYLLDRIGGPDKFAAIASGESGAWRDGAVLQALRMCQDLAKRGAFGNSFAQTSYDDNTLSRQLADGTTAMLLMGSWEYSNQVAENSTFASGGGLGWTAFPTVTGGSGDARNVVGNPSNYFSVSAKSRNVSAATDFVVSMMASNEYVDAMIEAGQVPAVKGAEKALASSSNAGFATFTYDLVSKAPDFTQSWDQALGSELESKLLTNVQRLFLLEITPEQFVAAMERS